MDVFDYLNELYKKKNEEEYKSLNTDKKLQRVSDRENIGSSNVGTTIETIQNELEPDQSTDLGLNDISITKDSLSLDQDKYNRVFEQDKDFFNVLSRKDTVSKAQLDIFDQAIESNQYLNQKELQLKQQNDLKQLQQMLINAKDPSDKELIQSKIDTLTEEIKDPSLTNMTNLYGDITDQVKNELDTQLKQEQFKQQLDQANLIQGSSARYKGYWTETAHAFGSGLTSLISKIEALPLEWLGDVGDKGVIGETLAYLDDRSRNANYYAGYNTKDLEIASKRILEGWKGVTAGNWGDFFHGGFQILKSAIVTPQVLAQSLPEMAVIIGSNIVTGGTASGLALSTTLLGSAYGAENIRIAQVNNRGKELSTDHKTGILLGSYINSLIQNGAGEIVFGHGINKLIFKNKLTGKEIATFDELKKLYPEQAGNSLWYAVQQTMRSSLKAGAVEVPAEMLDPVINNVITKYDTAKYKDKSIEDLIEEAEDEAIIGGTLGFFAGKVTNLTVEGTPHFIALVNNAMADRLYRTNDFSKRIKTYMEENGLKSKEELIHHLSKREIELNSIDQGINKIKQSTSNPFNLKPIENPNNAGEHLYNEVVKKINNNILNNITKFASFLNDNLSTDNILNNLNNDNIDVIFNALATDKYAQSLGYQDLQTLIIDTKIENENKLPSQIKAEILQDVLTNNLKYTDVITKLKELRDYLETTPKENKPAVQKNIDILNNILSNEFNNIESTFKNDTGINKLKYTDYKKSLLREEKDKQVEAFNIQKSLIAQAKQAFNSDRYTTKFMDNVVKPMKEEYDKLRTGDDTSTLIQTIKNIKEKSKVEPNDITTLGSILKHFSELRDIYLDNYTDDEKYKEKAKNNINTVKKDTLETVGKILKSKGIKPDNIEEKFFEGELDKDTLDIVSNLLNVLDEDGKISDEDIDILGSSLGFDDISPEDLKMLINFIKLLRNMLGGKDFNYQADYKKVDRRQLFISAFEKGSLQEKKTIAIDDLNWIITKLKDSTNQSFINRKKDQVELYIKTFLNDNQQKEYLTKLQQVTNASELKTIAKELLSLISGSNKVNDTNSTSQKENSSKAKSEPKKTTSSNNLNIPENTIINSNKDNNSILHITKLNKNEVTIKKSVDKSTKQSPEVTLPLKNGKYVSFFDSNNKPIEIPVSLIPSSKYNYKLYPAGETNKTIGGKQTREVTSLKLLNKFKGSDGRLYVLMATYDTTGKPRQYTTYVQTNQTDSSGHVIWKQHSNSKDSNETYNIVNTEFNDLTENNISLAEDINKAIINYTKPNNTQTKKESTPSENNIEPEEKIEHIEININDLLNQITTELDENGNMKSELSVNKENTYEPIQEEINEIAEQINQQEETKQQLKKDLEVLKKEVFTKNLSREKFKESIKVLKNEDKINAEILKLKEMLINNDIKLGRVKKSDTILNNAKIKLEKLQKEKGC